MKSIGPRLPLKRSSEDGAYQNIKQYKDEIKQNLKMIVLTNPGERIMMQNFGVGLRHLLFEQDQKGMEESIRTKIYDQTGKYLPVVDIVDVLVERNDGNVRSPEDNYTVRVKIFYDIPELMDDDSLEFKF